MSDTHQLLLLPGDGIGPEIMAQAVKVLHWLRDHRGLNVELTEELVGGASLKAHDTPIRDEVIAQARDADAVLFGSVGDPAWKDAPFDKRPEVAILRLRKELGLYANLRPAKLFDALLSASALKPEVVRGLDLMIVRETVGGVYFGEPRGIETLPDGTKRGVNTEVYTTAEIERVARVAFELARQRDGRVCSIEKGNVMESGLLWREVVTDLHEAEYSDVTLTHMLADNCAMQLVRDPRQFDVMVTGNLFGDLLSDLASMLTGSLGMLPSATLGAENEHGKRAALYEPIHGSAPDIAGRGIANPLAQILSLAMLLRYSLNRPDEAELIERAVSGVLVDGLRTADIAGEGEPHATTEQMGDAVLSKMAAQA
ncbi:MULTISPECIES: 3-isopropylmalate dehydrogenase [unclassified Saccharibacter]|uniref:3-isopropylmalate dehydrogenase n=1 Tax=unclassified Saccharibacter TaxID=2648722 RepID=UPI0013241FAF|nr:MULTISPECIES: 3-isopropylmalate dehydrogenase [unclassified Saccharibacter]MXV35532.1 3-isopropylmalate dehydrogenase [Saccharibacter sp. EH611]MXV58192.1 3-isopropylmalate dehydrogenase [Saccharibacter sp. EH70]MXV65465.1 3-isopropylmalate dehydrogenase [Saccharibacter sp. EH60]